MLKHPLPPGTRVRKINSEPGDTHHDGSLGTVVRSIGPMPDDLPEAHAEDRGTYGYFVTWDDERRVLVFIKQTRIEPLVKARSPLSGTHTPG